MPRVKAPTPGRPRQSWRAGLDSTLGTHGVPTKCAIARDLQETYPTLRRIEVAPPSHPTWVSFTDDMTGERLDFEIPPATREWIKAFDEGLNPPDSLLKLLRSKAIRIRGEERKSNPPPSARVRTKGEPAATRKRRTYVP